VQSIRGFLNIMSFGRGHGLQLFSVYKHLVKLNNGISSFSHVNINSLKARLILPTSNSIIFKCTYRCNFSTIAANKVETIEENEKISPTQMYEKALDFKAITDGDAEQETKLRVLCLEHEVMKQEGVCVPRTLNQDQWKQLLAMDSRSKRRKYYKFLFGIEIKKEKVKAMKAEKAKERLERLERIKNSEIKEEDDNTHIQYGLGKNSFLLRLYDATMNQYYNQNLIRAIQFGQKIVIDCDYDKYMTPQESSNCAKQLMITFSENRLHKDPFDIHLCNAHQNNPTIKQLMKFIPNLYETYFPLNVNSQSYLDLFPKQDIVYLTPHCRTELDKFDHDSVYVVGALVDKTNTEPLSLAKAKREGLRMAKLPLDRYLQWSGGSGKSLTINQMLQIMLEIRSSDNWEEALKFVPRRKLNSDDSFSSQPEQFNRRKPFQNWEGSRPNWKRNKNY
jgi:ribonuclease P protein 1